VQGQDGVLFLLAWLGLVEPAAVIGSNVVTLGATYGLSVDLPCAKSHHGDADLIARPGSVRVKHSRSTIGDRSPIRLH